MAAPTVSTRGGAVQGTATLSHSITLPASVASTDLVICIFSAKGAPTCSTSSTGWHKLGQASNTTVVTGAVFFTWGNNPLTVTTSTSVTSSHVTLRIPGGGVPWGQSANGNSTNSNPPSEAVSYVNDYLFVATRSGDAAVTPTGAPTGYSNLTHQTGASTGTTTSTAEKGVTASGAAEDPGTFTSATEQWVSWTLSIPNVLTLANQTVIDNFNDNSLNTSNVDGVGWEVWGGGNVTETGQQLNIQTGTAGTYHGLNQWALRTLNEQFIGSKLLNAGLQTIVSLEVYPALLELANVDEDTFYIMISGNIVYCTTALGPTPTYTTRGQYAYNSVIHAYGAVGERGGNIEWILSPDGVHWRILASMTDPSGGAFNVQGEIMLGTWQAEATITTGTWDDFSLWSNSISATVNASAIAAPVGIPSNAPGAGSSFTAPVVSAPAAFPAPAFSKGQDLPFSAAMIALVGMPAVSIGTSQAVNVTPTPIVVPASIPVSTKSAGSRTSPGAISAPASIPANTKSAGASATPGVVSAPASIPAQVVRGNVSVTASPIVAPTTMPASARSSSVNASAISAPVGMPAPAYEKGQDLPFSAAMAAPASIPAVVVRGSVNVTPSPIVAPASVPARTVSGGALVLAGSVQAPVSVPTAGKSSGSTASPETIAAPASVPLIGSQGAVQVALPPIVAPVSVPGNTVQLGATATPAPAALTSTVPSPTPRGSVDVQASPVGTSSQVPGVVTSAGAQVTPAAISAGVAIPATVESAGSRVDPSAIVAPISIPGNSISAGDSANPFSITTSATIPPVVVRGSVNVSVAPIACVVGCPSAILSAGANATPGVMELNSSIPSVRIRLSRGGRFAMSSASGSYSTSSSVGTLSPESSGGSFSGDV